MAPSIQDYDVISFAGTSGVRHDNHCDDNIDFDDTSKTDASSPLHERQQHQQQQQQQRRRTVSFAAGVTVQEVLHHKNYTPEELEASWYDRNGMRRMKQMAKIEAKFWGSGVALCNNNNSSSSNNNNNNGDNQFNGMTNRGLEGRIPGAARRKLQSRRDAYHSVFSEIAFQKEVDYVDEDMIADAYFIYSEPCAVAAQMMGQRDEMEARCMHESQLLFTDGNSFGSGFCRTTFVESLLNSTTTRTRTTAAATTTTTKHHYEGQTATATTTPMTTSSPIVLSTA